MRNKLFITILASFLLSIVAVSAQTDEEELRFWKNKVEAYKKNPLALKNEIQNYQDQIRNLKQQNREATESNFSTQGNVDSLRWVIIQLEGELNALKRDYAKLETAYKAQKKASDDGIKLGLVYRVQIGAYVFYEMGDSASQADDLMEEKSDGFNKYLLGNFRTYAEASDFKAELQTIGIQDGWVVPYIDGIRVTMDVANTYVKTQGITSSQ